MKILVMSLPVVAAALLVGCSADREAPASTRSVVADPPSSTRPSAPASTSAVAAPPVTVTVTAPPAASSEVPGRPGPCADTDLVVYNRPLESQGSEYRLVVQFENVTAKACTLQGYPGADIVDADLPVLHVERRQQNAAPLLTLQPGEIAIADLQASDVIRETGEPCGRWGQVVVIAPNTFQQRHLDVGLPMCSALISSVT